MLVNGFGMVAVYLLSGHRWQELIWDDQNTNGSRLLVFPSTRGHLNLTIGDLCGGFVGIDEDTKYRSHYFWARICVTASRNKCPDKIELDVEDWRFEISILKEVASIRAPFPTRVQLQGRSAGDAGEKRPRNISGIVGGQVA